VARRLNGPQTTGRTFRELSEPEHGTAAELDVPIEARDGTRLLADVFRPSVPGRRFPALVAFSAYPRQMQHSGAPMGFVEAGATDFWVARGYVHVIVNARGTGGSGGTYTMMDGTERADVHDAIEWTAAQSWCDGRVGMIGVSYFGMAQLMAAVEAPPALAAVFPFAAAGGMHQAVYHGGILSDLFLGGWLGAVGMLASQKRSDMFRSGPAQAIAKILNAEPVHRRFEHFNGEAAIGTLGKLMRMRYEPQPWADLYQAATAEHPRYDDFWRERDCVPRLDRARVPMHLGCAWDNVPLHLPGAFSAWEALPEHPGHRLSLLGADGLSWPWESMHAEALAWYDHWLKDRDTGALDGPPIRYWLRGAGEYRTLDAWPPPGAETEELYLGADGTLATAAGTGGRDYRFTPPALTRPASAPDPPLPSSLIWDTEPAPAAYDVVGAPALSLDATSTAADADWIAKLSLVDAAGAAHDLTQGWLRVHEPEHAEIELVPTAVRVRPGERLRLTLTSNDREKGLAMTGFTHLPLGSPSRQHVRATSRLALPVLGP
jgi:putative CocE/NonD family hydrolase